MPEDEEHELDDSQLNHVHGWNYDYPNSFSITNDINHDIRIELGDGGMVIHGNGDIRFEDDDFEVKKEIKQLKEQVKKLRLEMESLESLIETSKYRHLNE